MAQFIKAGKSIINIDAIARIEDLTTTGGLAEINVHLSNGEYVVVRDRDASALLDFFYRKSAAGSARFSTCAIRAEDLPPCSEH